MGKQQNNNGKGSLTNKQRSKIKPLHELSEEEISHLRRSGRYIPPVPPVPPVKTTFWQTLKDNTTKSITKNIKKVISLNNLGKVVNASVLIGVITFIAGEQDRRDAQVYQAWQVISAAHNQSGSGGRVQALEFLNSEPRRIPWFWLRWERESLAGLEAPKAYLIPSRKLIDKKRGIQLSRADLFSANLQGAELDSANLQTAKLYRANLQGAFLFIANLQGAFLRDANLQRAKLGGTNLQGAFLRDANLQKAEYTDNSTSPETCRSYLLSKYPCPTIFPPNFDPKAAGMVLEK